MLDFEEVCFALALTYWPDEELVALHEGLKVGCIAPTNKAYERAQRTVQVNERGKVTDLDKKESSLEFSRLLSACSAEMNRRGFLAMASNHRH